jgi:hypothetical protein
MPILVLFLSFNYKVGVEPSGVTVTAIRALEQVRKED